MPLDLGEGRVLNKGMQTAPELALKVQTGAASPEEMEAARRQGLADKRGRLTLQGQMALREKAVDSLSRLSAREIG